jgi:hypothetical protein
MRAIDKSQEKVCMYCGTTDISKFSKFYYKLCSDCNKSRRAVINPKCECGEADPDKFYPNNKSRCKKCVGAQFMKWKKTHPPKFSPDDQKHITQNPLYISLKNAEHRSKRKGILFNLVQDDIIKQLSVQDGKCYFSGQTIDVYNLSIDRIDSTKGYTPDNIKLTTTRINWMKGNQSNADFINLISTIYNYTKTHNIHE